MSTAKVVHRSVVLGVTLLTFLTAAWMILVITPQATGFDTAGAYARFQVGSKFGIVLWSSVWAAVVSVTVWLVLRRTSPSALVMVASACGLAGLTATASFLPFITVDLAIEHVVGDTRSPANYVELQIFWISGLLGLILALGLAIAEAIRKSRRKSRAA